MIHYREANVADIAIVNSIIASEYTSAPLINPNKAKVFVAVDDAFKIVGFYALQVKLHAEPMWIAPEYRGSPMWLNLLQCIEPYTRQGDTYVISENPTTEHMCEELVKEGILEELTVKVYVRRIPQEGGKY